MGSIIISRKFHGKDDFFIEEFKRKLFVCDDIYNSADEKKLGNCDMLNDKQLIKDKLKHIEYWLVNGSKFRRHNFVREQVNGHNCPTEWLQPTKGLNLQNPSVIVPRDAREFFIADLAYKMKYLAARKPQLQKQQTPDVHLAHTKTFF